MSWPCYPWRSFGWGLTRFAACLGVASCVGGYRTSLDAARLGSSDPFDDSAYSSPVGEPLAFGLRDDALRNYFVRRGPVAAHVLLRSGREPRVIAAFPANNQGIGVWFKSIGEGAQLSLGAGPHADPNPRGGELTPLVRNPALDEKPMRGVRATLVSSTMELSTELVLLGNVRTLRDYGYGVCLENAAEAPELRNETFELDEAQGRLRIRREQIGGAHWMELLVTARPGTTLSIVPRTESARPSCPLAEGGGQPVIVARSEGGEEGEGGVALELIALADDEPLTPIPASELFETPPVLEAPLPSADQAPPPHDEALRVRDDAPLEPLDALAFLSYDEKLLAGSWRFLTYFGRDTLLSLWLLSPGLSSRGVLAALRSVLERVELASGVQRPDGGRVDVGDVAHEEALGDYAALGHYAAIEDARLEPMPSDLRRPRYDYKMVDDDFLLAPLLVSAVERLGVEAWTAFLAQRRVDGHSFQEAALANLALVLERARPFADDPRAPAEKASELVSLHANLNVGQWRDSEMGLAFGRYPFDVNAALVPAALDAAASLYERLGRAADAAEARRLRGHWRGVEELFRIALPVQQARANVGSYAASVGVADAAAALEAVAGEDIIEYGIALDAGLRPLPVMHSDHGFVLSFLEPPDAYLEHVARLLLRPFPAGLISPAGVMVANPALADPTFEVHSPKSFSDANDDEATLLRDLFSPAHYHGAVVWSWQQALLAKGLRRQLARNDVSAAVRMRLEAAECALWRAIDRTRALGTGELWSWAPDAAGQPEPRPFGAGRADVDESNAIQLWSTVYLSVREPTPVENPRCEAIAEGTAGVIP
jgi:hypothetical protein